MNAVLENQELLQESLVPGTFYGLNKNVVTEYRVVTKTETNAKKYRIWTVVGGEFMKTQKLLFITPVRLFAR